MDLVEWQVHDLNSLDEMVIDDSLDCDFVVVSMIVSKKDGDDLRKVENIDVVGLIFSQYNLSNRVVVASTTENSAAIIERSENEEEKMKISDVGIAMMFDDKSGLEN